MKWSCRLVAFTAVALSTFSFANRADAFRFRRSCCYHPCALHRGDEYTCLKSVIYTNGTNDYIYYAAYYEQECGVDEQPEPYEDGYHAVPENCDGPNYCLLGFHGRSNHNQGVHNWVGMDHRLLPGDPPPSLSPHVRVCGCDYQCFTMCKENKDYKAVVYHLCVPGSCKQIHVAYELDCFPNGVNPHPIPLGDSECSNCNGFGHAYSIRCYGKRVLFLTAK